MISGLLICLTPFQKSLLSIKKRQEEMKNNPRNVIARMKSYNKDSKIQMSIQPMKNRSKNNVLPPEIKATIQNVNILQDPPFYRIDIAPLALKEQIKHKFEQHLEWLRTQDPLSRATVGFESAITYMMATDNTHLIPKFWSKTEQLDAIRRENILDIIPELKALK